MEYGSNIKNNGLIGEDHPIYDAVSKVTGQAKYTGDLKFPRMLYGKVLFSTLPHARIKSIDTSQAEAMPGVRAVVSYKNSPDTPFNSCGECIDGIMNERIFDSVVRFVGDKVAAVAADTQAIADQAVRKIKVEYEELPFYLDPEEAMKEDAYPLHEGGNVMEVIEQNAGDCEKAFAEADYCFTERYEVPAIHHSAIETHAAIADYTADGMLTVYSTSQDIFAHRTILSRIFGIPQNKVRTRVTTLGGGFGGKIDMVCEPIAALLAIKTGRPVKLMYNRREDIQSSRSRHHMIVDMKMGVMKDGTITAQDYNVIIDAGANSNATSSVGWAMCGKLFHITRTPNIHFKGTCVYTNTILAAAMRGYGSPQEFFAQQRMYNTISKTLGIDMTELELKNLMDEDGKDPRFGSDLGSIHVKNCVTAGREAFGWEKALAEEAASRKENGRYRIGVGVSVAGHGNGMYGVVPDTTGVWMNFTMDGSLIISTGVSDMGNGSVTMQKVVASDILGIPEEKITVNHTDTQTAMYDFGNFSSRGSFVSVQASAVVAQELRDKLIKEAAEVFEEEDTSGYYLKDEHVISDSGKSASLFDLVMHARKVHERDMCVMDTFASQGVACSFGAHFVKVQVDTETGKVKVLQYVAAHDVGTVLNPMNLEGQVEGGIQMGLGYALSEGIHYNDKGKMEDVTFKRYHIFQSDEMPPIQCVFVENSEKFGPYGAKSIGETATVPCVGAITNAVSNALEHDFNQVPLKPDVILKALAEM